MKEFYTTLINSFIHNQEIRDLYRTQGITPIQHIDLYAGQDFNPQYFELAVFPAMFVSFSLNYTQEPAIATIVFRLCYEQLRDTSSVAPEPTEALKFFDFVNITDHILQKMTTKNFGRLYLSSIEQQIEETVTDEFILTYTASFTNEKEPDSTGSFEDISIKGGLFKNLL